MHVLQRVAPAATGNAAAGETGASAAATSSRTATGAEVRNSPIQHCLVRPSCIVSRTETVNSQGRLQYKRVTGWTAGRCRLPDSRRRLPPPGPSGQTPLLALPLPPEPTGRHRLQARQYRVLGKCSNQLSRYSLQTNVSWYVRINSRLKI